MCLKHSQRRTPRQASEPTWAASSAEGWWWSPPWAEEPAEEEEPDRFQTGRWCQTKPRSKNRERERDHVIITAQRTAGQMFPESHLVHRAVLMLLKTSSHHRVHTDPSIKRCGRQEGGVTRTPLHIETPLIGCRQLVNHLKHQRRGMTRDPKTLHWCFSHFTNPGKQLLIENYYN